MAMSAQRPDITVIVRTSGRSRCYLDRALASIRAQTCRPAQVIISDDASAGPTPDVGDPGIVWVTRPPDESPNRSKALNRGIQHAGTAWLAFLDDDDTWHPEFLARMRTAVTGPTTAVCCRTQARYEHEVEGRFQPLGEEPFNPGLYGITLSRLAAANLFTNNAVLWPRDFFTTLGGYREDLTMLEDWEFNVRAAQRFSLAVLPETLAYYHQRPRQDGGLAANSAKTQHDRARDQLLQEWRAAGLLPPDRGWRWVANRGRELRHRWARWRFTTRWGPNA
ncbi:Putative glycosyltransferase EpsH [Lacunisphaera limnophila]|uniref:Glycosyltransferase EpsH n=1 Tax=Lacunisphaera limnophila TaxID=1838286 RepID=A0A1D8AUG9_9BACT|nr:glycosyltransferase family A protein [Lacunisphaera limnophila]AOS44552.1 Putative glycosyltransferase EpsH [Lacunisphaera limnophila]